MAYGLAVRRVREVVVQRGDWKVEGLAVTMAGSWVELRVDQWAVGLGYDVVEEKDRQTEAQRIGQWVEMMDVHAVDSKDVSEVVS